MLYNICIFYLGDFAIDVALSNDGRPPLCMGRPDTLFSFYVCLYTTGRSNFQLPFLFILLVFYFAFTISIVLIL